MRLAVLVLLVFVAAACAAPRAQEPAKNVQPQGASAEPAVVTEGEVTTIASEVDNLTLADDLDISDLDTLGDDLDQI